MSTTAAVVPVIPRTGPNGTISAPDLLDILTKLANPTPTPAPGGLLLNVQRFATPGAFVYTPTPGTNSVRPVVVGGGGIGGPASATTASTVSVGAGGASGSMGVGRFTAQFAGVTIVVGIPGDPTAGNGGQGGTSSFGALITAPGGGPGHTMTCSNVGSTLAGQGSSGGVALGAAGLECATGGQPGGVGLVIAGIGIFSGQGAPSPLGGGGGQNTSSGSGPAASTPGAGGGGGSNIPSQPVANGGPGGPGIVIVYEYS